MKKHYVYSHTNGTNSSKEKYTAIFLVGMCLAAALITLLVVGLSKKLSKTSKDDFLIQSEDVASVEIVNNQGDYSNDYSDDIKSSNPNELITEVIENDNIETLPNEELSGSESAYVLPCDGEILNGYSPNVPVYSATLNDWRVHNGIDIFAPIGSEVRCIDDGVIRSVYKDVRYGNTIVVAHGNTLRSVYSNLAEETSVNEGDEIKKGSIIAHVGDTALFETIADTHLHFEMINNNAFANPLDYLCFK